LNYFIHKKILVKTTSKLYLEGGLSFLKSIQINRVLNIETLLI